MPKAKRR